MKNKYEKAPNNLGQCQIQDYSFQFNFIGTKTFYECMENAAFLIYKSIGQSQQSKNTPYDIHKEEDNV